jgi:hypothetical protein
MFGMFAALFRAMFGTRGRLSGTVRVFLGFLWVRFAERRLNKTKFESAAEATEALLKVGQVLCDLTRDSPSSIEEPEPPTPKAVRPPRRPPGLAA